MRKSIVVTFLLVSVVFSDTKLEPTVISTSGFEQDISKEIRNVIVITKDDIVKKGYKNIGDVLKNTPGVSFKPTATAMGSIIDMRGTGANANTKVKVMIDDVTMNMLDSSHTAVATDTISIDDIERIEIIPGGGAVLYGNGTQGGVVNIITKTKTSKPYANIYTKYGSNSYNDLRLNTGGNINDKLFVKGSFNIYDSDGYRQYEKSKGKYGSVGLSYDFLDIHSFDIGASFFSGEADYAGSVSKEKLKENRRYSNKDDISKFKTNRTSITANYTVKPSDNFEFKISPFYQYTKVKNKNSYSIFSDKKYGTKLKAKFDYNVGNVIFGYDYIKNEGKNSANMRFRMGNFNAINDTKGDQEKITHSAFVLNTLNFTDQLSLTMGYRFEYADYDIKKDTTSNLSGRLTTTNQNVTDDETNHAFEITPNFKYSDTGNIYLKYERGFTSPPVNKMSNKHRLGYYYPSKIKSESYDTYEIGMKDLLLGQFFSATAFYTKTKDEISTTGRPPMYWEQVNLGETKRYGVEINSWQSLMDDKLTLNESFTYTHTEITKDNRPENIGKRIMQVPRYKITFGADYEFTDFLSSFVNIRWFGDQRLNTKNDKVSSYAVVDIGTKINYKGINIIVGINNLFDKEYYDNVSGFGENLSYDVADGRNYFVEFGYEF